CNEWLVGEVGVPIDVNADTDVDDDAGDDLVHESDTTLTWNVVFEAMGGNEPTTNTRSRGQQQSRKRKEFATGRGRPMTTGPRLVRKSGVSLQISPDRCQGTCVKFSLRKGCHRDATKFENTEYWTRVVLPRKQKHRFAFD
ncbi:hypothetical protein PIB30_086383, partial [Stylosanthes scabra]|nr:hypothetical protein [Stylosanthes scabra]